MATTTATCLLAAWSLVAAGLFGTGLARASFAPAAVGKEQREFDYFALALQWPGTICSSTRHCCAVNGCCRKEPLHTFTIHGLWPDYDDGTWPSCCRHTSFDMDKITPLKPTLDKYWPSLYCSSSSTCFSGRGPFWAHEWEKHGTCSAPAVQEELQYFTTALDLYFKHNVTEMLATGDILVSNGKEYALSDVIDIIKHAFGGSPQIICKKGSVEELRSNPLNWFTIHGLWPQYSYGGWPSCCRPTTTFNMNKIAMLRPILEKYWPSLYCGDTSTCFGGRGPFWAHEWATHGTCGYPEIQDEYDYFSTALYLYSKYNVTKALRKAHIYPRNGRKYAVAHIVDAIDHAFGRLPHLVCKNGSVQELRLCFHKDYQPRDCGSEDDEAWSSSPSRRSHCPLYVTLPSYKQSALGNGTEGRLRNPAGNGPRAHGQSYV